MRPVLRLLAVVAALLIPAAALVGSPAQAASAYHGSVGMTGLTAKHTTDMGRTVTISGKIWGGPVKNQKVSIYLANLDGNDAFARRLAVVPISSANRYTYRWKTDDAGAFQLRVVKGAYKGTKAVKVTSKIFSVFRWYVKKPGAPTAGLTVAGVPQPDTAYLLKPTAYGDAYVGMGDCRAMRLDAGVSDASHGDGHLILFDAEGGGPQEPIFDELIVKGEPVRQVLYKGPSAYYGGGFFATFGANATADDGIVMRDVQLYCAAPVKNQWNSGYWNDEYTVAYCAGEQVAVEGDEPCKIEPRP